MAPEEDANSVRETAECILSYLEEHPQAADTVRGVWSWWLRKQAPRVSEAVVAEALEGLVARGYLVSQTAPGGEVLFKRRFH